MFAPWPRAAFGSSLTDDICLCGTAQSAFQVRRCAYRTMMTGEQFFIQGTHLVWQGEKYLRMTTSESIPSFTGLRKFASLDCSPLTDTDRAALIGE